VFGWNLRLDISYSEVLMIFQSLFKHGGTVSLLGHDCFLRNHVKICHPLILRCIVWFNKAPLNIHIPFLHFLWPLQFVMNLGLCFTVS
jgi:hypothetical protein